MSFHILWPHRTLLILLLVSVVCISSSSSVQQQQQQNSAAELPHDDASSATNLATATNLISQYNNMLLNTKKPVSYHECYDLPWNKFIGRVKNVEIVYDDVQDKVKVGVGLKMDGTFWGRAGSSKAPLYRASIWHQESGELFKEAQFREVPQEEFEVAFFVEPGVVGNYEMTVRLYEQLDASREEMLCFDVPFKITTNLREEQHEKNADVRSAALL